MATLEQSVQSLIDQIHSGTLTPAEGALVAASISELSQHQTFQQALLAVAEGDLNTAVSNLEAAKATLNANLAAAETALNTSSDTNTQSLNAATNLLNQELQKLDIIPSFRDERLLVDTNINRNVMVEGGVGNGIGSNWRRGHCVYAVYDKNSQDTYAFMPSYTWSTGPSVDSHASYWCRHQANGNHIQLGRWYIDTNSFDDRDDPGYFYYHTSMAMVPLASMVDGTDIQYKMVVEEKNSATTSAYTSYYRGIRVYGNLRAEAVKPKFGVTVTDRYGYQTRTVNNYISNGQNRILYSNDKNCLFIIREDDVLIEVYSDGTVDTGLTFADNEALQTFVDANDVIVIPLVYCTVATSPHHVFGAHYNSSASLPSQLESYGGHYSVHFVFEDGRLKPLSMRQSVKRVEGDQDTTNGYIQGELESHFELFESTGKTAVSCDVKLTANSTRNGSGWLVPQNYDSVILAANPYGGQVLGIMDHLFLDTSGNTYYGMWKGRFK